MSDSTITIVGGLGKPPELRFTQGGRAVSTFGVAVSRRWKDKTTEEWQEQTSWINVVCWGDLAENVAASLDRGSRVVVTGRLEQRSWETDDGEKRSTVELIADDIGASMRWAQVAITKNDRRSAPADGASYGDDGSEPF